MKTMAILLIVGILFFHISMVPVDNCSQDGCGHMGNMKVNCGFSYHCPLCSLIVNTTVPEPLPLPLIGQLFETTSLAAVDDLTRPIFRPPEYQINNSYYSEGMKQFHLVQVEF
jgi:hypothetical protein